MKIQAKRLLRFQSSLVFPLPILAAASDEVAAFVSEEEFQELLARGAVFGVGSRAKLKQLRFLSADAEAGYVAQVVMKTSDPTRAIPSVDMERSESGHGSYVMRRLTDDGQLIKLPEFKRAA